MTFIADITLANRKYVNLPIRYILLEKKPRFR
jgi:hypothetical protein